MSKGRQPDYRLALARKKDTKVQNPKVGAAWKNKDGGITLVLSPGVVLDWRMMEDFYLTLWPQEATAADTASGSPRGRQASLPGTGGAGGSGEEESHEEPPPPIDDDIPF